MGKIQKLVSLLLVVSGVILLSSACQKRVKTEEIAEKEKISESFEGKTYYTTVNIWYENPNKILSTNYHVGVIIPIGTKVRIGEIQNKNSRFVIDKSGLPCTIIFIKKHSAPGHSITDLFAQCFSEQNPLKEDGPFNSLSSVEKENVKKGEIAKGMSKSAVLMAYGYPPSHRTSSLKWDIWKYWKSRVEKVVVFFQDDKVVKIKKSFSLF